MISLSKRLAKLEERLPDLPQPEPLSECRLRWREALANPELWPAFESWLQSQPVPPKPPPETDEEIANQLVAIAIKLGMLNPDGSLAKKESQ